jgi:PPOX class probable F420-dependent enzyme
MPDPVDPPFLTPGTRAFLGGPRFASLTSLDPDGAPHTAVVWYRLADDATIVVNSAEGRRWPANLRRDPRVSLAVLDGADGYRWFGAAGRVVEVVDDQAAAQADIAEMARRYHAAEPARAEALIEGQFRRQRRVSFRIRLLAVHDELGADAPTAGGRTRDAASGGVR